MPGGETIPVGSRWLHGPIVYEIRALRPIEPGCPAWGARRLVLATPEGEDPHPLDWVPDTWLRHHWTEIHDEILSAAV